MIIREKQEVSEKCQFCLFVCLKFSRVDEQRRTVWRSHAQWKCLEQNASVLTSLPFQRDKTLTSSMNEGWVLSVSPTRLQKINGDEPGCLVQNSRMTHVSTSSHNFLLIGILAMTTRKWTTTCMIAWALGRDRRPTAGKIPLADLLCRRVSYC